MKSIYNFTVNMVREVEEKSTEKRENKETGKEEEVEVSKKVEKKIPYDIILKEPNRRQLEDADMEYSIEISRCIKKGILTKAMLAKKYSDTGGILTEKDAERLVDLYGELSEFESEASKLGINTSYGRYQIPKSRHLMVYIAPIALPNFRYGKTRTCFSRGRF